MDLRPALTAYLATRQMQTFNRVKLCDVHSPTDDPFPLYPWGRVWSHHGAVATSAEKREYLCATGGRGFHQNGDG
jgi:hypothetical protein